MRDRIQNIKARVNMTELLSRLDLLPYSGAQEEFQMRCPFHGQDTKPSARIYRNELFKCFACGVAFDVVGFFSEYKKVGLKDSCYLLEKDFKIEWEYGSESPKAVVNKINPAPSVREVSLSDLVRITEKQLIERKSHLGLEKYAKSFYVLDRAEESNDIKLLKDLRSRLELGDAAKRYI